MEITPGTLVAEIAAAAAREVPEDRAFTNVPLGALLDHIVSRYHMALRENLPRRGWMADKVAEVHGERHAELNGLAAVYRELRAEAHEHVHLENNVLFPRVVSLNARAGARRAPVAGTH